MKKYDVYLLVLSLALLFAVAVCSFAIGKKVGEIESTAPVAPSTTYCVQTLAAKTEPVTEQVEAPKPTEPELVSLGTFKVTHYCPCSKCCGKSDGITATGTVAVPGRTLAVDPRVIPYGTKVVLKYNDGTVEDYIAEDRGGSIRGNRVDVFMGQHRAALYAGVRTAEVFIVKE